MVQGEFDFLTVAWMEIEMSIIRDFHLARACH